MPRELWAKVAVEIVRDPKLILRAPWERWLWLGLICLTKEFGKEGVLTYDPRALAVTLDLGVKPAAVQTALEAFEKAGMVRLLPDNAMELVHFKKRQEGNGGSSEWSQRRALRERTNFVYLIENTQNGLLKIGTSKNPWARLGALQLQNKGAPLRLAGMIKTSGYDAETELHERFKAQRTFGEWFRSSPELLATFAATPIATVAPATGTGSNGAVAGSPRLQQEEEEEEEEEIYATADLARSGEAAAAVSSDFKPLASFLAATWPAFNEPAKTAEGWTAAFPKLDLLAAARAARAKELATGETIVSPGAYLQSWFDRAEARRVAGPKASGNGRLTEGTPEWDAAKRAADERAKREIQRTKELLDARERVFRQGHE